MSDTTIHEVGDRIVTTVYSRGDRSAEVVGIVTEVIMSKRYPDRIARYTVDAADAGYGLLSVEATKARKAADLHPIRTAEDDDADPTGEWHNLARKDLGLPPGTV